jgi:SAM-dependent methyltransferase
MRRLLMAYIRLTIRVYDRVAGKAPDLRFWHFQHLAIRELGRDLRELVPRLRGHVIDVGCGDKPYAPLAPDARFFGIDVFDGPQVDAVVDPHERWPVEDASFDGAVCTQVLEHAADHEHTLAELRRVLRPGGTLILSVPWMYHEHGAPYDFRRFSRHDLAARLEPDYVIRELRTQGGVGATIAVTLLAWVEVVRVHSRAGALLTLPLMPIWLAFCAAVNAVGSLLDRLDRTGAFYANVLVLAERR